MSEEPPLLDWNVRRRPSGLQSGKELLPSNVKRLQVARARADVKRSSLAPLDAAATRRPSGDRRGCQKIRSDVRKGRSPPIASTQTSVVSSPVTPAGMYASEPVFENVTLGGT